MPQDIKYDPIAGDHVFPNSTKDPTLTEGADGMAGRALSTAYDGWVSADAGDIFGNKRFTELLRGFDSPAHRAAGLRYDKEALAPLVSSGALKDVDGNIVPTSTGEQATRLSATDVMRGAEITVTTLTGYER